MGELSWVEAGGELGCWSWECVCEWVGEEEGGASGGASSVTKVSRAGSYIVWEGSSDVDDRNNGECVGSSLLRVRRR